VSALDGMDLALMIRRLLPLHEGTFHARFLLADQPQHLIDEAIEESLVLAVDPPKFLTEEDDPGVPVDVLAAWLQRYRDERWPA